MICRYPACRRITISDTGLCRQHRIHEAQFAATRRPEQVPPPTGEWAIAAAFRDEITREDEDGRVD
jgi:hypothetical protein